MWCRLPPTRLGAGRVGQADWLWGVRLQVFEGSWLLNKRVGTVVGDGDFSDLIDNHLVQSLRS